MSYDVNDIGESVSKLANKMSDLSETATDAMKGNAMGDIAGLLALMQNNKGTDLPGLLSLAKERGYDKGWGGEGMFLFVFLILFLFAGGGWGGLNRGQQADFAALAGTNAEELVGLHDRIADARNATQSGFQQMQRNKYSNHHHHHHHSQRGHRHSHHDPQCGHMELRHSHHNNNQRQEHNNRRRYQHGRKHNNFVIKL